MGTGQDGGAGETLVGSGSFRVDPNRGLEVLRSRQVEAGAQRMGLWVRAAALRGASRAEFKWGPTSLTIRFGGKPLSAAEMRDPFSALLSGASADPASRWFALALLHTALPKVRVTVESGAAEGRKALSIDDKGLRVARPTVRVKAGAPDTVVRASWSYFEFLNDLRHPCCWRPADLRPLLEPCPLAVDAPCAVKDVALRGYSLRFEPVLPDKRGFPLKEVRKGGLRILLRPGAGKSGILVRFCVAGVAVEGSADIPFRIRWETWVDDPLLELDASLRSAVQGERWHAALKAVEEEARGHSLSLIAGHGKAMRLAAEVLARDRSLRGFWKRLIKSGTRAVAERLAAERRPEAGWTRYLRKGPSGDRLRLLEAALVASHLRPAAAFLREGAEPDGRDSLRDGLWTVPLYFDAWGVPRCEREARALHYEDRI